MQFSPTRKVGWPFLDGQIDYSVIFFIQGYAGLICLRSISYQRTTSGIGCSNSDIAIYSDHGTVNGNDSDSKCGSEYQIYANNRYYLAYF